MNSNRKQCMNKLVESIKHGFQEKTHRVVGSHFDITEIIKFYGGIIEFADIYDDENKLDAYICKVIDNDNNDFKIVIDNKMKALQESDIKDDKSHEIFNFFVTKLFYYVVINEEEIEKMQNGDIIYPSSDIVEKVLKNKNINRNSDTDQYKLVGTINLLDSVPDFICPVFENNGKYYYGSSENSVEIDSFNEITDDECINEIRFLFDGSYELVNIKKSYSIGDERLIAFQIDEDNYFVGNMDAFNEFIKNIKIDDHRLIQNIKELQDDVAKVKNLIKN